MRNQKLSKGQLVCGLMLAAVGALSLFAATAPAQPARAGDGAAEPTVAHSFQMASLHWGVPIEILMAVGYVESHWEQRDGAPSLDKGYGIMHLVDGPGGTLQRSAELTGFSAESIQGSPVANIEAGAALLDDISRKLNIKAGNKSNLIDWLPVVAEYSGAQDAFVRSGYAQEVFRVVREGRSAALASEEVVTLSPTDIEMPPALLNMPSELASDDYGPALWVPANANNYRSGRPYGSLNFIIIHDTEGSYSSAINWFQNPSSGVSAQYVIRSSDGQITQMVRDANTGYHAGNWDYNVRSLGIEHEGYMNQQGWYTEAMYQASSALARHVADRYGIKKDRAHVVAHSEVPGSTHRDPGPYWNWTYYMSLVRRDSARTALVDNTDPGFQAVPTPIDPQHYWYTYNGGYNNSNTYGTSSVSNVQYSINSGTWTARPATTGNYDVYAFIPYVDNNTPDTASARYKVYAANGMQTSVVSQQAITDRGTGSWAHLGRFLFNGGSDARVYLDDYTGESGRNVWFDAVMWIPTTGGGANPTYTPVPPRPTNTPVPPRPTNTFTRVSTSTWTRTPTYTPTHTPTPQPTWTPGPCNMRFTDLPDTHWAYEYVVYLFCNSIITGYTDGTFRPGENTTRAQIAKMLTVGFGWALYNPATPTFSDVPFDSPYYQYVETAYFYGVAGGYSDGTFRPGNAVTRAQVTKMLALAKGWPPYYPPSPSFSDVPPDNWAYGYVEAAFSHGVIAGYADGTFRPGAVVNRAQFSKMLTLTLR